MLPIICVCVGIKEGIKLREFLVLKQINIMITKFLFYGQSHPWVWWAPEREPPTPWGWEILNLYDIIKFFFNNTLIALDLLGIDFHDHAIVHI